MRRVRHVPSSHLWQTQELAGVRQEDERAARQEDERAAQQKATQQSAGARQREGGAVRGRREDETAAQREATQQPACTIRRMWFVMRLADSNVPPRFDPTIWIAVSTHSFELV